MAYVIAAPEMMTAAATDLATIATNVNAAHMVAAAQTTSVIPAAADEVSAGIAHLFSQHAANYQALAGKATAFNDQFVQTLKSGGGAYAQTEATSAAGLKSLLSPLLSLVPPEIKSDLQTALLLSLFLVIAGFVIVYLAFGILVTLLFHPQQLLQLLLMVLPQQLLQLGL